MESESSTVFEIIVSWLPMVILIIIWWFYMKKTGISENKKYMEFTTAKINDQLEEMKLINKNLENIYNALKEKE